jgi:Short C-terminal domain
MPLMRRRMGPGLLGMAARTAVVAGTATVVSNKVQDHHAEKQQEQYDEQQAQQQQNAPPPPEPQYAAAPPPPPPPAAPVSQESVIDQLKELGELKQQGILTDEEFAAQKAKLLG